MQSLSDEPEKLVRFVANKKFAVASQLPYLLESTATAAALFKKVIQAEILLEKKTWGFSYKMTWNITAKTTNNYKSEMHIALRLDTANVFWRWREKLELDWKKIFRNYLAVGITETYFKLNGLKEYQYTFIIYFMEKYGKK